MKLKVKYSNDYALPIWEIITSALALEVLLNKLFSKVDCSLSVGKTLES